MSNLGNADVGACSRRSGVGIGSYSGRRLIAVRTFSELFDLVTMQAPPVHTVRCMCCANV